MKQLLAFVLAALIVVAVPIWAAEAFDGTANHFRAAGPVDEMALTFWVMRTGDGADSTDDAFVVATDGTLVNWEITVNTAGPFFRLIVSGLSTASGATVVANDTWYFLAFRRSGTTRNLYLNGSTTAEVSLSGTGTAVEPLTRFAVGGRQSTGSPGNRCVCRIAALKVWSVALTAADMANEMYGYRPRHTQDLSQWIPLFTYANPAIDFSGNGRDFSSITGTPTTGDGPPISW